MDHKRVNQLKTDGADEREREVITINNPPSRYAYFKENIVRKFGQHLWLGCLTEKKPTQNVLANVYGP